MRVSVCVCLCVFVYERVCDIVVITAETEMLVEIRLRCEQDLIKSFPRFLLSKTRGQVVGSTG